MEKGRCPPPGMDAPHIVALPAAVETNAEGRDGVLVVLSDLHIGGGWESRAGGRRASRSCGILRAAARLEHPARSSHGLYGGQPR
ncbi:MAG: hypothetical protein LC793_06900 [Thermomicrobia bacterium]|nr:hypothetical protein [Thermomicrobia bacterium]